MTTERKVSTNIQPERLKCISWHCSRTVSNPEFFGQISGVPSWSKCHVLPLNPQPNTTPLNPFPSLLFRSIAFGHVQLKADCCKGEHHPTPSLLFLPLQKSCSFQVVRVTGRKGRSPVDAPWVLRMRHSEPFPAPIQLGLPCSHCSARIHMYFSTIIPLLFLLKSALLKSVGYCSGRTSTWIQYGSPFYVFCSRWKVKEKWQIPRAISVFMCTMRFLSYFIHTFVSYNISVT